MTPEKALELVGNYARLTKEIKLKTAEIGAHLDLCKGMSGNRQEPDYYSIADAKGREVDLHLVSWYTPEREEYGRMSWADPDEDECAHCYAAHQVVMQRKALRQQLGNVKRVMSRVAK